MRQGDTVRRRKRCLEDTWRDVARGITILIREAMMGVIAGQDGGGLLKRLRRGARPMFPSPSRQGLGRRVRGGSWAVSLTKSRIEEQFGEP